MVMITRVGSSRRVSIRVGLSCTLAIILLSLTGFRAQAQAPAIRETKSPRLHSKTKAHKARIESGTTFTTLYNFCSQPSCTDGSTSYTSLIRDAVGNLYGTTSFGGANSGANGGTGAGAVFEVNNAGQETVLYSFCTAANCTDGALPTAPLVEDAAGNLYGTTSSGGIYNSGTVFKLEPPSQQGGAWTEVVLYNFCALKGCADGENPVAGLIQDAAGNLYGTTYGGGPHGWGAVFEVNAAGVESVLYSFRQPSTGDGNTPEGSLFQDAAGNLYGTTFQGGANQSGTVFKLTKAGVETVLYSFCSTGGTSCTDGANPLAGLIQDAAGNFYSTTNIGGAFGYGTAFELSPAGAETVLYSFCSTGGANCTDGAYPLAGLLLDSVGSLYGTTDGGGAGNAGCDINGLLTCGTVFELSPPGQQGGAWSESVLYSFCSQGGTDCTDGAYPEGGLIQDASGNLYSTTSSGGANVALGGGTVFMIAVTGQLTPTVTLTSTPNPSFVDQSVTLSVVVTGSGPVPTGTVKFQEGSTNLGTVTLANGKGSITTAFPAAGSFSIVANYSGDSKYKSGSSNSITQVVNQYTTSTALASSPNPSNFGQTVTFTATVSSAGPTPTGTVTFLNGGVSFGSAALSGGVAVLNTTALPVGSLSITASYSGDAANAGSTSSILTQVVKQDTTSTSLTSSPNPSIYGQTVTFTATVSTSGPTPTGTVTFLSGKKSIGTATLSGGVAQFITSTLTVGTYSITAVYGGDAGHAGSKSSALKQVVNKATSSTALTSAPNPSKVKQKVKFTATVTSPTTTSTGKVTFMDGNTALGTGNLKNGVASFTTSSLSSGSHNITAVYPGTTNINGSTSPVLVQVVN